MPIYEFKCGDCNKVTNFFTRKIDLDVTPNCENCGSANLTRLVSSFGRAYTRADILDMYGDASNASDPDAIRDPRQIGTWVEKRFDEYGVDLPDSAREMIDAARDGEMPGPVKDL